MPEAGRACRLDSEPMFLRGSPVSSTTSVSRAVAAGDRRAGRRSGSACRRRAGARLPTRTMSSPVPVETQVAARSSREPSPRTVVGPVIVLTQILSSPPRPSSIVKRSSPACVDCDREGVVAGAEVDLRATRRRCSRRPRPCPGRASCCSVSVPVLSLVVVGVVEAQRVDAGAAVEVEQARRCRRRVPLRRDQRRAEAGLRRRRRSRRRRPGSRTVVSPAIVRIATRSAPPRVSTRSCRCAW